MLKHILPFGSHSLSFSLPEGEFVRRLAPQAAAANGDPQAILAQCLRQPIGSPELREIAAGKSSAAILIPGKARRAGTRDYVPALIAQLEAGGIPAGRIEIFLADGAHEQHLDSDLAELLGPFVRSRVRCLGHDCRRQEELRKLGTTSRGTPVWFNQRVLDADVKVLTGRITPHYFAGFSGGRKALLPGVAGIETIVANHRLTLGPERGIHPAVRPCSVEKIRCTWICSRAPAWRGRISA